MFSSGDNYDVEKAGKEVEERDKFLPSDGTPNESNDRDSPTRIGYSKQQEAEAGGDGKVSFRNVSGDDDLEPLNKEELFAQASGPCWSRSRWFFIILFWLAFIALFVAVICIILAAPKCPGNQEWYKSGISYQIFPRTFSDSNDDGLGDIQGIIQSLDYLSSLGIQSLWLGPLFPHGDQDNGNDVTSFTEIDPDLGTIEDYQMLVEGANSRGIRVILNFIPNHSSNDHPWFQASQQNISNSYYVWRSGTGSGPPNNWLNALGGPAWTHSESRKEWYLHTFLPEEPDLNYRNEELVGLMQSSMEFWLKNGASGFYMKDVNYLVEFDNATEEDEQPNYLVTGDSAEQVSSVNFTRDLDENHEIVHGWRKLMNKYNGFKPEDYMLLVADVKGSGISDQLKYFGTESMPEADYTYNQALLTLSGMQTGFSLSQQIQGWLSVKPKGRVTSWALGDSKTARSSTRFQELAPAMNVLLLTLPGTANVFYGEEIGMTSLDTPAPTLGTTASPGVPVVTPGESNSSAINSQTNTSSPLPTTPVVTINQTNTESIGESVDPVLIAMQWNNKSNAGFTNSTDPLIPVNDNYPQINVEIQEEDPFSMLNIFRQISALRGEASFLDGAFRELVVSENVYAFTRHFPGYTGYLVAINLNLGSDPQHFQIVNSDLPKLGTVVLSTDPNRLFDHDISLNNLILNSYEAIIISYD